MRQIQRPLVVGVTVDCGHRRFGHAELVVQNLGYWGEAIRGTGRIRYHRVGIVELIVVHTQNYGDVFALRGSRDDHSLDTAAEMLGGQFALGEQTSRFDHDFGTDRIPRNLGWVALGKDLDRLAVHGDAVFAGGHVGIQVAQHRVVLEQVCER